MNTEIVSIDVIWVASSGHLGLIPKKSCFLLRNGEFKVISILTVLFDKYIYIYKMLIYKNTYKHIYIHILKFYENLTCGSYEIRVQPSFIYKAEVSEY
jgi:hypothetical protein